MAWGAVIAAAAKLGEKLWDNYESKKAAKTAYERNLYMSSTAHQRAVEDLEKAGLNPVLSALGNGASVVSTPVSSVSQDTFDGNTMRDGVNSAIAYYRTGKHEKTVALNNAVKEGELLASQSEAAKTQSLKNLADASLSKSQSDVNKVTAQGITADNTIKLLKSKWFNGLSPTIQADIFNSMMYPSNMMGQMRGASMQAIETIENGVKRAYEGTGKILKSLFNSDIGASQGGRSSAKSIQEDKKTKENNLKWLKNRKSSGGFF